MLLLRRNVIGKVKIAIATEAQVNLDSFIKTSFGNYSHVAQLFGTRG